ncbi:hypothetical protein WJX84_002760 [Apatococcus fuscideae]|uniref:PWWP domain-containing protein n=1 Tax=Apatococcus fuscideae TaxID=2026836 RepID=A0AAW1T280_9CHLO
MQCFHTACPYTGKTLCQCSRGMPSALRGQDAQHQFAIQSHKMWQLWQQQQDIFQAPAVDIQLPRLLRRVKKELPNEHPNGLPSSKDAQRTVTNASKVAEAAAMRAARLAAAVGQPYHAPPSISLDSSDITLEDAGAVEDMAKQAEASQANRHRQLQQAVAQAKQRKEAEAKAAAAREQARAALEARQQQEEQERARVEVARKREQQRAAAAEAAHRQEQRRQQERAQDAAEPMAIPSDRPRRAAALQSQRRRVSSSDDDDAAISDSDTEAPHGNAHPARRMSLPGRLSSREQLRQSDPTLKHDGSHGEAAEDLLDEEDPRPAALSRAQKGGEAGRPRRVSPHGQAPTQHALGDRELPPEDDDSDPLTSLMAGVTKKRRTNMVPAGHEQRLPKDGQKRQPERSHNALLGGPRPTRQAIDQKQPIGSFNAAKANSQFPPGSDSTKQPGPTGPKKVSHMLAEPLKKAKPAAGQTGSVPLPKGKTAAGTGHKMQLQRVMLRKKDLSMDLVDRHLQVFWPDDGTWWPGKVTALNLKKCEMTLFYETGEEEANMDLAALIKDGQVAWLHAADIPPDMRMSQGFKPSTAPKGLSNSTNPAAALEPAGPKPSKKRRLETLAEPDEPEPAKLPKKQRGAIDPQPAKHGPGSQAPKSSAGMAHRQSLQEAIAAASRLPTGPRPPSQQNKRSPAPQQSLQQLCYTSGLYMKLHSANVSFLLGDEYHCPRDTSSKHKESSWHYGLTAFAKLLA